MHLPLMDSIWQQFPQHKLPKALHYSERNMGIVKFLSLLSPPSLAQKYKALFFESFPLRHHLRRAEDLQSVWVCEL